jgi:hypothetical protein
MLAVRGATIDTKVRFLVPDVVQSNKVWGLPTVVVGKVQFPLIIKRRSPLWGLYPGDSAKGPIDACFFL